MLFALPPTIINIALIPHMGVVLISIYLVFAFRKYLNGESQPTASGSLPQKVAG
jgi:hypothetical protein